MIMPSRRHGYSLDWSENWEDKRLQKIIHFVGKEQIA